MLIRKNQLAAVYICGLVLVALAVSGSYFLVDYQLKTGLKADQVVRMGYQQAWLTERINALSLQYLLPDGSISPDTRQQLSRTADEMRQLHEQLLKSPDASPFAREADKIYFDPEYELDLKLRTFLGAARELADYDAGLITPLHPLVRFLDSEKTDELHVLLKQALEAYQRLADKNLSRTRSLLWGMYLFIMLVLLVESLLVFRLVFRNLVRKAEAMRDLAHTDPLTGCRNRRSFVQTAEQAQQQVNTGEAQHALLMLDIDHFKQVNDHYGHPMGDKVIRTLAETCIRNLRSSDVLGRLGGEEFAILLSGSSRESAGKVAEQLRLKLEACRVPHDTEGKEAVQFTVSIGVTSLQPGDDSAMQAVERADVALYRAKEGGRNRVIMDSDQTKPGDLPPS